MTTTEDHTETPEITEPTVDLAAVLAPYGDESTDLTEQAWLDKLANTGN